MSTPCKRETDAKRFRSPSTTLVSLIDHENWSAGEEPGQSTCYQIVAELKSALEVAPTRVHARRTRQPATGSGQGQWHRSAVDSDRIGERTLGSRSEYADKKQHDVKGERLLDEADKKKQEEASKEAEPRLKKLKNPLGDRVGEVNAFARLADPPSCLALCDYEMAPHLARLLREAGQDMPESKPTLESKPVHRLVKRVETENRRSQARDLATLLLEQAKISAGAQLPAGGVCAADEPGSMGCGAECLVRAKGPPFGGSFFATLFAVCPPRGARAPGEETILSFPMRAESFRSAARPESPEMARILMRLNQCTVSVFERGASNGETRDECGADLVGHAGWNTWVSPRASRRPGSCASVSFRASSIDRRGKAIVGAGRSERHHEARSVPYGIGTFRLSPHCCRCAGGGFRAGLTLTGLHNVALWIVALNVIHDNSPFGRGSELSWSGDKRDLRGQGMALQDGLYDLLVTERLLEQFLPEQSLIEELSGGGADVLAEAVTRQLADVLDDISGEGGEKLLRQLELVNALLVTLRQRAIGERNGRELAQSVDLVSPPVRLLKAVDKHRRFPVAPQVGLGIPWLFTASKGTPSLLQEIRSELSSSDRVDILVSFITVSGVRKIADVLRQVTALSAQEQSGTRIRVLTTTYTGATELRALDELARLPGCEIRISLDGRRTRLHAKAWIFHRSSGFGSAYIGSANLSGAAMTGGLEWTVKLAERAQNAVFARAQAHFETLWDDNEFQSYDPDNDDHRRALVSALARESGVSNAGAPTFFDLQPKNYQQEMLDRLTNEREHGRYRNLVVAATGTGKTMVAAFDYRHTCAAEGGQPRLLFVAHREEILRQALYTWRAVLRDPEFGELLTGGSQPGQFDHLFATIDSLTSRKLVDQMGASYWHTVIVDECHRLAANRFDAFVTDICPRVLLGLTATPERSDGKPIANYFDARPDGSPAVELRLWHALDLQLLAPFEYYACDDVTDFSAVPWDRPGERMAVDHLVTGNDVRARLVVNEWQRLVVDPRRSKALVFCVSVAHAKFMTDWFNAAGLPAACVVGDTPDDERRHAPQRLARGELCALVTVDLYNEGVDLPSVDTLLLLRPTQSGLLFQQQIGRGLRLAPGKENCLILDFVGQHRTDFRFDRLLSVLTGLGRQGVLDGVEHGFSQLPPGCYIQLQRQTREQVLRGLKAMVANNWRRLRVELQAYAALRGTGNVVLADFLREQALELEDVYRGGARSGWTELKRDAGLMVAEPGPEEAYFSRRIGELCHANDPRRLDVLHALGVSAGTDAQLVETAGLELQMLAYQVDGTHAQVGGPAAFAERVARNPAIGAEMTELADVLQGRESLPFRPLPGLADTPLCLHAGYHIREVLTAVGWLTATRRTPFQAGRLSLSGRKTELLFVTLDKSAGYHDRIAYRDYAISRKRFHWQTQNSAGPDNASGRRYLESPDNGWQFQLFVRTRKGEPYLACGRVVLESIDGNRPMNVVWCLEQPLPARWFREFSMLRGG